MATIRINRIKEFKSSVRRIKIEINGRCIGSVKNGETKNFQIQPGILYIKATLDGICTSNPVEIEIKENEIIALRLSHKKGFALFDMIFNSKSYFVLEKIST